MILTHRAIDFLKTTRLGVVSQEGETLSMEITQEDLKAQLMQQSEEFRHLAEKHADLKKRVHELEAKSHPTEDEQLEELRLKKLKLQIKDQMSDYISRHHPEHVV